MPVTAKLSQKFYERLGDDIATELVNWFNAVDAAYRADLERFNELNFQRFDAKVEQRFAEADARFEKRLAKLEVRFEGRFTEFDKRLVDLEVKFDKRLVALEARFEKRIAESEIKFERRFAEFDKRLETVRADLIKWAFLFWMPTALAVLGLYFR